MRVSSPHRFCFPPHCRADADAPAAPRRKGAANNIDVYGNRVDRARVAFTRDINGDLNSLLSKTEGPLTSILNMLHPAVQAKEAMKALQVQVPGYFL